MKKHMFAAVGVILISMTMLLVTFCVLERVGPGVASPALASLLQSTPTIAWVDPVSAPNDLDIPIIITGSGFTAGLSGTLVITQPMAYLGNTALNDVTWVSSTTLEASVPWGLEPGVYTLTVQNQGGASASLPNAFTVTLGIGVWNATALYGGDVQQVVVHSQMPETVYAVSEKVGLFRSRDGGDTWVFIAAGTYVNDLAIVPTAPDTLYMSMIGQLAHGLHRSDDGGDTWTPLNAPGDRSFPHPTDTGTLFVSNSTEGEGGLWKSTDYGQTWLTATTGLTETQVNDLVFDPTDPLTLYAGTVLGNLFVSSNGGASWTWVARPLDFIQALAINPRGDHELWVSNCCFCQPNTTLRSTNAAHTTWATVADPVGSMSLNSIEFAPNAWREPYSQTLFVSACFDEVMRSDNGGDAWAFIDPQVDESHKGLGLHPSDPNVLYATGSRQAIYKTGDGGTTWNVAHEGLTAVIPSNLATVAGQPDVVYAVTEIGLLKGTRGGATWQVLPVGGDVSFVATDPFTPSRVYAAGGDVGEGDLPMYISGDGGQTWPTTTYLPVPPQYDQYAHLDPVIQPDPSQPGVLLAGVRHQIIELDGAGAGSLYRSTDAGLTWAEVDVGQVISAVQDIAFDVVNPSIVYLATSGEWHDAGSGLFRSTDSGLTWQRMGAAIADLDQVRSIAVEPRSPHRVFALVKGLANMWVYVSADQGLTWSQTSIVFGTSQSIFSSHDQPDSVLYLVTGMGLLRSTDGGVTWGRATGVLGRLPVYSLAEAVTADRTVLYVGTTGGYVESGGAQALSAANSSDLLVNAGVYRYTTRPSWRVYLPLALRAYEP